MQDVHTKNAHTNDDDDAIAQGREDAQQIWNVSDILDANSSEEQVRKHMCALRTRLGPSYKSINPVMLTQARIWNLHWYCGYENPSAVDELQYVLNYHYTYCIDTQRTPPVIGAELLQRVIDDHIHIPQEAIDRLWSMTVCRSTRFFRQSLLEQSMDPSSEYAQTLANNDQEVVNILKTAYHNGVRWKVQHWDAYFLHAEMFETLSNNAQTAWLRDMFGISYHRLIEVGLERLKHGYGREFMPPQDQGTHLLMLCAHLMQHFLPEEMDFERIRQWWNQQSPEAFDATMVYLHRLVLEHHNIPGDLPFGWFQTSYPNATAPHDAPACIQTLMSLDQGPRTIDWILQGAYVDPVQGLDVPYEV